MIQDRKTKGWKRLIYFIIPYFFIVGLFQFFGAYISDSDLDLHNENGQETTGQHLIVSFFGLMGTVFVLWLFMKYIDKEKFVHLGFQFKNRLKDVNIGLVLGFLIMSNAFLLLMVLNQIEFLKIVFNFNELVLSILVYILVAISEEIVFRGYVLRNLMSSFNKYSALIASSAIFALAHGFNPNINWLSVLSLFLAGILLGISYVYTKNLWFPIALHFSWNFFQTLFGFNVSGQEFYSLIEFEINNKNILNGGDFGFEGSIFAIIVQVICILFIFTYFRYLKPKKSQY